MRRLDWEALAPLGQDGRRTARRIGLCLGLSTLWGLCQFLASFLDARQTVLWAARLGERFPMPSFAALLSRTMLGFEILAVFLPLAAAGNYLSHYLETRSIYLMRRLPDRRDLWRRCLALPAAGLLGGVVLALALLGLFLAVYRLCTPWELTAGGAWWGMQ